MREGAQSDSTTADQPSDTHTDGQLAGRGERPGLSSEDGDSSGGPNARDGASLQRSDHAAGSADRSAPQAPASRATVHEDTGKRESADGRSVEAGGKARDIGKGASDPSNRTERPQLASDKSGDAKPKGGKSAEGARTSEVPLPMSRDNPLKVIAEHPNMRANWERALEKAFGQGSYQKNIEAYRKELEGRPSGSSHTPGTKQEHAASRYNEVRREFNRQEGAHPSYKYSEAQHQNLRRGNSPDYQPRTHGADGGSGKAGPELPNRQVHHIEHRSTNPERALDANNVVHVEGSRRGSTHHESHHGEGAKRQHVWKQEVAQGKRPEAKPAEVKPAEVKPAEVKPAEVKPPEVKPPEVKAPGAGLPEELKVLGGAAGKLLGVAGELLMVRGLARDLEFSNDPGNAKWGKEYEDMYGHTFYRQPDGHWSRLKDDIA